MRSSIANAALMAGEMSYFAGVGPASVSATLSGMPSRAVWVIGDRLTFELIAKPAFKTIADLRSKKLGVIGLGGTNHVSLVMALEKSITPRDRKSTRLNSSHLGISYAVFCLKKKKKTAQECISKATIE